MNNIDDEINQLVKQDVRRTSGRNGRQTSTVPPDGILPRHDFVSLGEKVAMAMVQAAEEQVTQAENKLKEVQAWADGLRHQVKEKDRELADMTDRIAAFGESVLEANRKFHEAATATPD